jgi:hypothetical protein
MMATSRHARLASTALRLELVDSAVIGFGLVLILVGAAAWTAGDSLDAASVRRPAR